MSKFKVGDRVVVTKARTDWRYWTLPMTELVGEFGEVVDRYYEGDEGYPVVRFEDEETDWNTYFFPDDALDYQETDRPEDIAPVMELRSLFGGIDGAV